MVNHTKCSKCGADVKYIPIANAQERTAIIVEPDYIEVIQDTGRAVKGHLRHTCQIKGGEKKPE